MFEESYNCLATLYFSRLKKIQDKKKIKKIKKQKNTLK